MPGIQYPRVPGHEVIGVIDAVGPNVPPRWKAGQRVGVGWNGGYCGYCDNCRRGDFFTCQTSTDVTGVTRDGGYAEYMLAPTSALALVPDELSVPWMRRRSCAPASPRSTVFATAAHGRATWLPWSASAASATWRFNTRRRWAAEPSPSRAEKTKSRWPGSSAHIITSTTRRKIPRPNCKSSAAQRYPRHRHQRRRHEAVHSAASASRQADGHWRRASLEVNTLQCSSTINPSAAGIRARPSIPKTRSTSACPSGVHSMNEVFPARSRGEALRSYAEWQSTLPRRAQHRRLISPSPQPGFAQRTELSWSRWSSWRCGCRF